MFTGIIERVGTVVAVAEIGDGRRITIRAEGIAADSAPGDSIAVDGACLTVAEQRGPEFTADVSPETLRVTTLGGLKPGDRVNLERALRSDSRLGGHFVLGHVDTVGTVARITARAEFTDMAIDVPEEFRRYLVLKGSVAADGVSLTVAEKLPTGFSVALVPVTLAETTLGRKRAGDRVNIETDILGKYVWTYLHGAEQTASAVEHGSLTMDKLRATGFIE